MIRKPRLLSIRSAKKANGIRSSYERTFKTNETKEVQLFGFGGDDEFEINGNVKKSIKVRIIGGEGDDQIIDNSKVAGIGKKNRHL